MKKSSHNTTLAYSPELMRLPSPALVNGKGATGRADRCDLQAPGLGDGGPRPTNLTALALAEPYAERLIGTLRRDCLDHVLVFGARHLRRVLAAYSAYYNETRTHLSLDKDAP